MRGLATKSESVQCSRAGVEIGACSGPSTRQQASINNGRESLYTRSLDSDDEGTCCSIFIGQVERRVIAWDKQADNYGSTNIKEKNTDIYTPDGLWDVAS